MVISIKDGFKFLGISIVAFCAVFVCTFMLNYYMDVAPLRSTVDEVFMPLYKAQLATATLTSGLAGGVLGLIAVLMLIFYIKLYVDAHSEQLGIIKAMGYSNGKIAMRFWVFGLCVFLGCALGYAFAWTVMRVIYNGLTIEGMDKIAIHFHAELLFGLVIAPSVLFALISCFYAYFALNRPVIELIRGKRQKIKATKEKPDKDRGFLLEMCFKTLSSKKSLAFFVAFSCFCFSAMVQMGLSMENLTSATMGYMILAIGVVLAVVTMFMAVTTLIRANMKNIAVMKAFGYPLKDCALAVLGGYAPFALVGFAIGTAYQYGLLQLMVNVVFKNVGEVPEYKFDVPVFFITFAVFIVCYLAVMAYYTLKISKVSVKQIMAEN